MTEQQEDKLGVAFITTPRFREKHAEEVQQFVATDLWHLCKMFNVLVTGGTYDHIRHLVAEAQPQDTMFRNCASELPFAIESPDDLERQWKHTIRASVVKVDQGYPGMIKVTNDMIVGRIDAVIHLMDWDDVAGKPDTMVLRRQANVHDVPIACDLITARAMVASWKARSGGGVPLQQLLGSRRRAIPKHVRTTTQKLEGLKDTQRVIALIAHNGMKLAMCHFVVEHAKAIVEHDAILATGTTGKWIKRFLQASDRTSAEVDKVLCCLSGPVGGDVQIAWMVVQGICRKVIFFQDPMVSHAHATDILLFEQALLYREVERALATNPGTAAELLER